MFQGIFYPKRCPIPPLDGLFLGHQAGLSIVSSLSARAETPMGADYSGKLLVHAWVSAAMDKSSGFAVALHLRMAEDAH